MKEASQKNLQEQGILQKGLPRLQILRMLLQSWAAVAVSLILVMVNLVNGDDCFVPDTTWEAEINHGITNVATEVPSFLFLPLHCV